MNKDCIVLIPVYRPLDKNERAVVRQTLEMTRGFTTRFLVPRSFVFDGSFAGFEHIEAERFDDDFFTGIPGYNRLMLSRGFYERFTDFKYILISQTDAWIFKPELQYWCDKGWDYIGAPWYKEKKLGMYGFWQSLFRRNKWLWNCKPVLRQTLNNNVGNGGLSLRKVGSFLKVLDIAPPRLLASYRDNASTIFNEDVFWGIMAPLVLPGFRVPGWREAMRFSLDRSPSRSYEVMGGTLPFGCHAFMKMEPELWRKFIPLDF